MRERAGTARRGCCVTAAKRGAPTMGTQRAVPRLATGWGPGEQEDQRGSQQGNLKSSTLLNLDVLVYKTRLVSWTARASL